MSDQATLSRPVSTVDPFSKRVLSLELTGEPERRLNNTQRGFECLPLRVVPV